MIPEQQHSDRVWTRAHDAVLAEKCEGLKVFTIGENSHCYECFHHGNQAVYYYPIPNYATDQSATIRAAEAWRKGKAGRWWAHGVDPMGNTWAHITGHHVTGPAALAWALWEAVKDA